MVILEVLYDKVYLMCITPIKIKAKKTQDGMVRYQGSAVVPCGSCPKCKARRAHAWCFRLQQQERVQINALFVTLTYAPEFVPISDKGRMTLRKRDFQLFMKRLRFNTKRQTIKYYACGEYGTDTWRPHFHAIMYDVTQAEIDAAWRLGGIFIGTVSGASIAYTTKYICKDKRVPAYPGDDRIPEFSLMSKSLGKNYLTPQMKQWHVNNKASYVVAPGGVRQPLPRYYRDFIFSDALKQELFIINQAKRVADLDAAMQRAGGSKAFYRLQYESIKNIQYNDAIRQRTTRNKI